MGGGSLPQEEETVLCSPLSSPGQTYSHIPWWGRSEEKGLSPPLTVRSPAGRSALLFLIISTYFFAFTTWEQYGVSQSLLGPSLQCVGSLFLVVRVLYVVCVVTQYLLTPAHTNTNPRPPHLSSFSSFSFSFNPRLDWLHFRNRIVDVFKQQIHSFNPLPAVQT